MHTTQPAGAVRSTYIARVLTSLLFASAVVLSAGCAGSSSPAMSPMDGDKPMMEETLTWSTDAQPVIAEYCTPCHFDGGYMYSRVPLDSYAAVMERTDIVKRLVWETRSMPFQRSMPDAQRELVARWIDSGAHE